MFDVDFKRFVAFRRKHGGLVTLFTHPNSHPYDSGLIIANKNGSVEKWLSKEDERPTYYKNRVNAGVHVINPKVLELADQERCSAIAALSMSRTWEHLNAIIPYVKTAKKVESQQKI